MSHPQSYAEGEASDSQQAKAKRGSKVTSKRVALLVLCAVLATALVVIYRLSFAYMRTKDMLKDLEGLKKKLESANKNFTDEPCDKCEEGWEQHGGKCYYFSISKSSWEESRNKCRAKGGDLVKIDDMEKQKFLDRRLGYIIGAPQDKFWIGLTDSAEEGRWLWVDGSPLDKSLTYWGFDEPDDWKGGNPEGEDCARMGVKGGAHDLKCWFDASCNVPHRSICEKQKVNG